MASSNLRFHGLLALLEIHSNTNLCHDLGQLEPHLVCGGQRPLEGLLWHAQVFLFLVRVLPGPHICGDLVLCVTPRIYVLPVAAVHSTPGSRDQAKTVHHRGDISRG